MNEPKSSQPAGATFQREKLVVWLLCVGAAIHVFVYSAAIPVFNNYDEECHFDLVVKYSEGKFPRGIGPFSGQSLPFLAYFGTMEYFKPDSIPSGTYPPPPWVLPKDEAASRLANIMKAARYGRNYESSQGPLYYALVGALWRAGKAFGAEGANLVYGIRFLNIFVVGALIWLGYFAARLLFPEQPFLRLGVAALLALQPQSVFYAIENDVLTPVCFGTAFVLLILWIRQDVLTFRLAAAIGLALAASLLAKISDLPLVAAAGAFVLFHAWRLARSGTKNLPAVAVLLLTAGLPMAAWLAWNKHVYGDFSGSAPKMRMLTWTYKPFSEWWHHPIFTPAGFWTFISRLLATFWQGELFWHGKFTPLSFACLACTLWTFGFVGIALAALGSRTSGLNHLQRTSLWFGAICVLAGVVFLGYLSIIFDFHECAYPSTEHPYFTSGRLILGAEVPFFLLFVYGFDRALNRVRNSLIKPMVLAGMILFMLISEAVANWPVFFSQYNWFHV